MRLAAFAMLALVLPAVAAGAGGTWSSGAPLPDARGEVAAARVGGLIYVVGGFTADGTNSPRVDAYSPAGDSWQRVADLPVSVDHTMAAADRGRLYVAGGYAASRARLTTFFVYSGGSWSRLAPLPEPRAAAGAVVVGRKLYVVGGVTTTTGGASRLARSTLVYDLARRRWSQVRGPTPREHLAVVALRGRIFAVGGRKAGADTNLDLVESYRPGARRWVRLPRVPAKRGGTGAAAVSNRFIVSVGGETAARTIRTVYRYDAVRRRWSRLPNLPTPRHGLGVAGLGGKVYVLAGGTSPGLAVSSANEILTLRSAAR